MQAGIFRDSYMPQMWFGVCIFASVVRMHVLIQTFAKATQNSACQSPPKKLKNNLQKQFDTRSCRKVCFLNHACRRCGSEFVFLRVWVWMHLLIQTFAKATQNSACQSPPKKLKNNLQKQFDTRSCRKVCFLNHACRRCGSEFVFLRVWVRMHLLIQHVAKISENSVKIDKNNYKNNIQTQFDMWTHRKIG